MLGGQDTTVNISNKHKPQTRTVFLPMPSERTKLAPRDGSSVREPPDPSHTLRSLIVVSSVLGTAVILLTAALVFVLLRRRRCRHQHRQGAYAAAAARDAFLLARPEHEEDGQQQRRRGCCSWLWGWARSRGSTGQAIEGGSGGPDAERQRSEMIRKSLQSRSMVNISAGRDGQASPLPMSPPLPVATVASLRTKRSMTWHGGGRGSGTGDDADADVDSKKGVDNDNDDEKLREAQARVDYMWQLLNRKAGSGARAASSSPPSSRKDDGRDGAIAHRPPTIRLKTPPLLAHPAFRGWSASGGGGAGAGADTGSRPRTPKHSSLPTELMAIKPSPL